jgi:hypothetical protein
LRRRRVLEAVFTPEARAKHGALNADERADLDRILRQLELNPWRDGVTKFTVFVRGQLVGVYDDGAWEVAYRVVDDRFLEVVGFTRLAGE